MYIKTYFRQPAYFGDFRCIGGDCNFSCCTGWKIDWKDEEIEKLKNAPNISDELLALANSSFEKVSENDKLQSIKFCDKKICPFLTEDKLCRIQKELGVEYLSNTCNSYPRIYRFALDIDTASYSHVYRFCYLSCPEVAKRLVTDKKAMDLINVPVKEKHSFEAIKFDSENECEKNPELLFRTDLFEFFYGLISDKKFSVETALIHGAIAAGILTDIVKEKNYGAIPQALEEMRAGFLKGNMFRELDEIKPDYNIKAGFVGGVIQNALSGTTMKLLKTPEGKLDLARYIKGEKKLEQMFDGDDYWIRNIALNLLFEFSTPLYSTDCSILENYSLFMLAVACIKFNAIASVSPDSEGTGLVLDQKRQTIFYGTDRVWGFASVISRGLCQNDAKAQKLIKIIRDAKLTTPMQLALLIK